MMDQCYTIPMSIVFHGGINEDQRFAQWLGLFSTPLTPRNHDISFVLKLYQLKIDVDKFLALPKNYLARNLSISSLSCKW